MAGMNASTRRTVIHDQDLQSSDSAYLVDNGPWQDEIRKRVADSKLWSAPSFGEATALNPVETPVFEQVVLDPKAAYEEALEKGRREVAELTDRMLREARTRAEGESENILSVARNEAERLKTEAQDSIRQERDLAKKAGEQEGRLQGLDLGKTEGLTLGKSEGLREYQARIMAWDNLFKSASDQRHAAVSDMNDLMVDLVGEALHRCLQREAQERPAMVVDLVRLVLQKAHDRVRLRVHLNPEDLTRVEDARKDLQLSVGAGNLELVQDARIEKGGCLLETEAVGVDARLGVLSSQAQEALKSGM